MTTNKVQLITISDHNFKMVSDLIHSARQEGYLFVQRTLDDWVNGTNKFNCPGEQLYGLMVKNELIGIGGLNIDPYTDDNKVGRVRHVYILKAHRRNGYASVLMRTILEKAGQHFTALRLYTDSPYAALFYETLGFVYIDDYKASHILHFNTAA